MSIELVMPSNCLILCHPLSALNLSATAPFPVSRLLASDDQSIGALASASVRPMTIQSWFPLGWLDLLAVQGPQESSPAPQSESINFSALCLLYLPSLSYTHMANGKRVAFTIWNFVCKVMSQSCIFSHFAFRVILSATWHQAPSPLLSRCSGSPKQAHVGLAGAPPHPSSKLSFFELMESLNVGSTHL